MKKKSISHYWDKDVLEWLKKEAKRTDRSVSWILNNMVRSKMGGKDNVRD